MERISNFFFKITSVKIEEKNLLPRYSIGGEPRVTLSPFRRNLHNRGDRQARVRHQIEKRAATHKRERETRIQALGGLTRYV